MVIHGNDGDHENNADSDDDDDGTLYMNDKVDYMTTLTMVTKVGPCRVLAEGGCLGGLHAPRFQFSYFESLIDLNCSKLNLAQF